MNNSNTLKRLYAYLHERLTLQGITDDEQRKARVGQIMSGFSSVFNTAPYHCVSRLTEGQLKVIGLIVKQYADYFDHKNMEVENGVVKVLKGDND